MHNVLMEPSQLVQNCKWAAACHHALLMPTCHYLAQHKHRAADEAPVVVAAQPAHTTHEHGRSNLERTPAGVLVVAEQHIMNISTLTR